MRDDIDDAVEAAPNPYLQLTRDDLLRSAFSLVQELGVRRRRTPEQRIELTMRARQIIRAFCARSGEGPSYPAETRIVSVGQQVADAFLADYAAEVDRVRHWILQRAADFQLGGSWELQQDWWDEIETIDGKKLPRRELAYRGVEGLRLVLQRLADVSRPPRD